ncbi:MAG: hypothetical protein QOJ01_631 [Solirubrobacterales bacterium]|nr:hypothetical protein [Solirubrobacterales bacterium]
MAQRAGALASPHRAFWDGLTAGARRAEESAGTDVRQILVGDVRLELRFAGNSVREAIFPALQHLERLGEDSPAVVINLWDSAETGVAPPPSPFDLSDLASRGEMAPDPDGPIRVLCLPDAPVFMAWNRDDAEAVVWVRDSASIPGHELASPLRTLLQWMLEPLGVFPVHAASVAREPGGVLLAGFSGAGKSTTSVACLERGFTFAGDDYVALTGIDAPRALSLYSTVKLKGHGLELLQGVPGAPRGKPIKGVSKEVLYLGEYRPELIRADIPLRAIVLPSHRVATGVRRTSPANSLRALAAPSILAIPQNGHGTMRYLAALVAALPSYEIGLDGDLDRVARELAALCEGPT